MDSDAILNTLAPYQPIFIIFGYIGVAIACSPLAIDIAYWLSGRTYIFQSSSKDKAVNQHIQQFKKLEVILIKTGLGIMAVFGSVTIAIIENNPHVTMSTSTNAEGIGVGLLVLALIALTVSGKK